MPKLYHFSKVKKMLGSHPYRLTAQHSEKKHLAALLRSNFKGNVNTTG